MLPHPENRDHSESLNLRYGKGEHPFFICGTFKDPKSHPSTWSTGWDRLRQIIDNSLRIQVCPKSPGLGPLHSYSKDGIGTLSPILGRGLDS